MTILTENTELSTEFLLSEIIHIIYRLLDGHSSESGTNEQRHGGNSEAKSLFKTECRIPANDKEKRDKDRYPLGNRRDEPQKL